MNYRLPCIMKVGILIEVTTINRYLDFCNMTCLTLSMLKVML